MNKKALDKIKEVLLKEKESLIKDLNGFAKKNTSIDNEYDAKFPDYGDDEDENASEVADFESDLYLEKTLEKSLEKVDSSLKMIENGTYGKCTECGKAIPEERLEAFPTANKCMECKRKTL